VRRVGAQGSVAAEPACHSDSNSAFVTLLLSIISDKRASPNQPGRLSLGTS
jgi:hypothetical protein